jgi:N-acetylmuramoyl-L-alanine amidase
MSWWRRPRVRDTAAIVIALGVACAVSARAAIGRPVVERVRYVGTASYSRVVVDVSGRPVYTVQAVPGDGRATPPFRLVIDVSGASIGPEAREPLSVGDSLLRGIRTGQYTVDTARVVLDFARQAEYRVFVLPDPYRLVVDMRGDGHAGSPVEGVRRMTTASRPAGDEAPPRAVPPAEPRPEARSDSRPPAGSTGRSDGFGRSAPAPAPAIEAEPIAAAAPTPVAAPRVAAPAAPEVVAVPAKTAGSEPVAPAAGRFKIVIDPGHGGKDPGARGIGGTQEKDVVLAIARDLARRLRANPEIDVVLTREDDRFVSLEERTALANAAGADLFLSVHANANPHRSLRGIEVYYLNNTDNRGTLRLAAMENGLRWDPSDPSLPNAIPDLSYILSDLRQTYKVEESRLLAEQVGRGMVARLGSDYDSVGDPTVKEGPFYVLVGAYMPCVLVEVSYLTNPVESTRLKSASYRKAVADGIYEGVWSYITKTRVARTL